MKTSVLESRLAFVEKISYGLVFLPVLSDFLEIGRLPNSARELITEIMLGSLVLVFIAVLHRVRKQLVRLEKSRQELIELICREAGLCDRGE